MHNLLPTLLEEFHELLSRSHHYFKRDVIFPDLPNKIKVAIGMRKIPKPWCVKIEL
ncbi:MAG: hypothetical protein JW855_04995 [Gammaproteobacteria bacterium]|nr:hypothetical protein [Gammaproteobacteria bacterium]